MIMNRIWDMPNSNTFEVPSIGAFVKKYLRQSKVSIDPFARNCGWATYTNDLNPDTSAQYHMDALDFLKKMRDDRIVPDLVIFDPPYSPRQIKEVYDSVGLTMNGNTAHKTAGWKDEKDVISSIMPIGSVFLHFGWHTNGMGLSRNFAIEEILLVAHGAAHCDTICMAERKVAHQLALV